MKNINLVGLIILTILLIALFGMSETDSESVKISGYMVGDYYYVKNHHDEAIQGRHGFWFRRIYLTFDKKLSDSLKVRLRFETASSPDFVSKSLLVPFVKDAYLSYSFSGKKLIAGIMNPPSFAQLENIWRYRILEKTPLDLQRWTTSRDFGIALKGGKTVTYHAMFGNGSDKASEIDNGKKFYASLGYKKGGFFLEAMSQFSRVGDAQDIYIFQGLGAYQGEWGRVAVQYAHRRIVEQIEGASDSDLDYNIFSTFAILNVRDNLEVIVRYDKNFGVGYRKNFQGSRIPYIPFADNAESNFIIGALSWEAYKNIWLIPNIKYVFYQKPDEGEKPGDDLYFNFTLWFKF